jgi:gas vesicle protein
MIIEVPADKYEAAIVAFEQRIKNGEVAGVEDPGKAKEIVKKGYFSYEQAKNIAKIGIVESLAFDTVNGVINASSTMSISAMLAFALAIWNGKGFDAALKSSIYLGIKLGGATYFTEVLSDHILSLGFNGIVSGGAETFSEVLIENAVTGAASVVVLSTVDIINIMRGRISGMQLLKNISNTACTVAGGTAGWIGGAAVGSVFPFIGSTIGAFVGGLVGSFAAGTLAGRASNAILNKIIEDDANKMVQIIERQFIKICENNLLNQQEAENIIENLKSELSGGKLKDMYASQDRDKFAHDLLVKYMKREVRKRKRVTLPPHFML